MSDDFNPYHQWLGIPDDKCPPTHYELLGISFDEEDDAVIRTAAQRQRTHVEQFKSGPQPAHATQILYQIDEAEITVLNPQLRRDYDRQLKLFKKRRKRRQIDPIVSPSPIYVGRGTVGEETGFFREYLGIMSVLLGGFIIMAVVSFYLPWRKVVFNNHGNNAGAVGHPGKAPVKAQRVAGPIAQKQNGVKQNVAPNQPDPKNKGKDDVALATIDATITVIDVAGRSLTISRKTKTSILDVSRKAQIIIAGKEVALDSLVPNQMASITFDPNFDVITKIEVAGADSGPASAPHAGLKVTDNESFATVDVTIGAIDVAGRAMTITRKSKTIVFDVSRKAVVMVNGKAASLESLKPGQRASITFDPEYDIVVGVEAAATENGSSPARTTTAKDKASTAAEKNLATIDGTITAIDAADRSITVTRKSKSIEFDVSRKARVLVDGKPASLDSLKPGQKADITFNTEFDVVMKIEIASSDSTDKPKQ